MAEHSTDGDTNVGNPTNERNDLEYRDAPITTPLTPNTIADDLYDDAPRAVRRADEAGEAWDAGRVRGERARVAVTEPSPEVPVVEVVPVVEAAPAAGEAPAAATVPLPPSLPADGVSPAGAVKAPFVPAVDMTHETGGAGIDLPGDTTSDDDFLAGHCATHPIGVGIGAAIGAAGIGAAVGFTVGAVVGPFGVGVLTALGAAIGALVGGYIGKWIAELVVPSTEDHYWRSAFPTRPYARPGTNYEMFRDAYAYGVQARQAHLEEDWSGVVEQVRAGWAATDASQKLPWQKAEPAIHDAWDRLSQQPEI